MYTCFRRVGWVFPPLAKCFLKQIRTKHFVFSTPKFRLRRTSMKTLKQFLVALVATLALAGGFQVFAQVAPPTTASPNYTALWWNPAESGWGINLTHQENIIFATMFTYRDAGLGNQNPPMWYVGSALFKQEDGSYFGEWYQTVGSAFNANPFVPLTPDRITQVGTARLTFSGNTGTITYSVNGVQVTKTMEKQVYGLAPAECKFTDNPDRRLATNYQDLWWNPSESGWGVNFTHQYAGPPRGEILFATMFTYANASAGDRNPPMWYVASEMIKQPDGSFYGFLYQTTGSAFNAVPFVPLTPDRITPVGTMQFTPIDGQTGTLVYSVNGVTVVKTITRQVYRYPVFVCTTVTTPQPTYTDKVYTLYVGGYPYAVTKTGVTKVKNMTQYTSPGFGLFDCD
ncbi:MAG: serine protease, partial [Patescibacteria group bacterium]|nr:serine protease [Patescibacteria group bacterium]